MNRIAISLVLALTAALDGASATLPIYINGAPLDSPPQTAPQIDARAWANQARFNVTRLTLTSLPFESLNTRFFTNTSTMFGDPGFRFLRNTNGQSFPMDWWVNRGDIVTDHASFLTSLGVTFFFNDSSRSVLQVSATNIVNTAPLSSGSHGLIRLEGGKIDISRSTLRTGPDPFAPPLTSFTTIGASNYVNDVGIYDLYWGRGTNNTLDGSGATLDLTTFDSASPPSQSSEVFELFQGVVFQSFAQVPTFFTSAGYTAAAYVANLSSTSRVVQVVFFPASTFDPSFTNEVRFVPRGAPGFSPATVMVAFRSKDIDIVSESETSESIYLVDGSAVNTNRFFARNLSGLTRRPATYQVSRNVPFSFDSGTTGNVAYSSALLSSPSFQLADVTNGYTAYSVQVDLSSSSPSGAVPYDPTNMPGRIEILGGEVNLEEARIRADSSVTIKTSNLVGNHMPQVDAPFVNLDLRSVLPELVISNVAPLTVRRLSGTISAWSGTWQNFETDMTGGTTNTITVLTHVLIVDSQLQSARPVTVNEFSVHGANIVVNDQLNIGKSFRIEGNSWHLTSGLILPFGQSLGASNLVNLRNFTNDGIINISGSENFGGDRALSYSNYVNHGTNIAAAHYIRTRNFENSAFLQANGGLFTLDAVTARLVGNPLLLETNVITLPIGGTNISFTNITTLQAAPTIDGVSDVRIYARDLIVSNSIITAGNLLLSVTNLLADGGTDGLNHWSVTNGFQFVRRPANSSLLNTYLRSTLARQRQAEHVWAATNLGASAAGFTNNLALGKLTLDGGDRSLFRFSGTGTNNALYVDYLELLNGATNFNSVLAIAPNFTIYFANANVGDVATHLDGAAGGRLRWVPSYAGPLSSTNLTYPSGNTYAFNTALVTSHDLDSNGNGTVNSDDPFPICVPSEPESCLAGSVTLSVRLAAAPERCIELGWTALAHSSNFVEFKASASAPSWLVLTNFKMGGFSWPVTVADPVTTNSAGRVYRLRVDPGLY